MSPPPPPSAPAIIERAFSYGGLLIRTFHHADNPLPPLPRADDEPSAPELLPPPPKRRKGKQHADESPSLTPPVAPARVNTGWETETSSDVPEYAKQLTPGELRALQLRCRKSADWIPSESAVTKELARLAAQRGDATGGGPVRYMQETGCATDVDRFAVGGHDGYGQFNGVNHWGETRGGEGAYGHLTPLQLPPLHASSGNAQGAYLPARAATNGVYSAMPPAGFLSTKYITIQSPPATATFTASPAILPPPTTAPVPPPATESTQPLGPPKRGRGRPRKQPLTGSAPAPSLIPALPPPYPTYIPPSAIIAPPPPAIIAPPPQPIIAPPPTPTAPPTPINSTTTTTISTSTSTPFSTKPKHTPTPTSTDTPPTTKPKPNLPTPTHFPSLPSLLTHLTASLTASTNAFIPRPVTLTYTLPLPPTETYKHFALALIRDIAAIDTFTWKITHSQWIPRPKTTPGATWVCTMSEEGARKGRNSILAPRPQPKVGRSDGRDAAGNRPMYPCGGSIAVCFSASKEVVSLRYSHHAVHEPPPPPPPPVSNGGGGEWGGGVDVGGEGRVGEIWMGN